MDTAINIFALLGAIGSFILTAWSVYKLYVKFTPSKKDELDDQKFIFNKAYATIGALLLVIVALVVHIYTDTQASIKNIERHTAYIPLILERVSNNSSDIAFNTQRIIKLERNQNRNIAQED